MSSKTAGDSAPTPRTRSLAARLTLWYTGSAFILVLSAVGFLYWALVTTLEHEDDQFLLDKANMVLATLRAAPGDLSELRAEIERETGNRATAQLFLRVLDENGKTLAATVDFDAVLPANQFAPATSFADTANHAQEMQSNTGRTFRALAMTSPNDPIRIIHVAMDRTAEENLLFRYRCYAGAVSVASLVISGLVGFGLARRGLRPLQDITHAAQRVQSSTLHERIDDAELPAELAILAGTFNEMLNRLEDSFRRLEQFSADIAHELRTPVHNLRGEAEVALSRPRTPEEYREVVTSGLEEYSRLSALIDSLLFLARAESPQAIVTRQFLNIGHELHIVREFYQAAANEAGVGLTVEVTADITVALDRTLFQRAVSNLLANALAHTPPDGTITIMASSAAATIRIEITDTGTGIAPEHLPHVFDRFYRADPARTSATRSVGLGLALVKSIATLHGGECGIDSQRGQGTRAWVAFPIENEQRNAKVIEPEPPRR